MRFVLGDSQNRTGASHSPAICAYGHKVYEELSLHNREKFLSRVIAGNAKLNVRVHTAPGFGTRGHGSANTQLSKLWCGDFVRLAAMPLLRVEAGHDRVSVLLQHDVHRQ